MSYASLASNRWISRNNLYDAAVNGFILLKTSFTLSDEWVRKDELATWAWINESDPQYVAKASNQWVTKNDITGETCVDFAVGGEFDGDVGMQLIVTISNGPLPAGGTLSVTFSTDNGGSGSYDFVFSGGESGTYGSGYFNTNSGTPPMTSAGSGPVTDVTINTITYTTSDTSVCYKGNNICLTCFET